MMKRAFEIGVRLFLVGVASLIIISTGNKVMAVGGFDPFEPATLLSVDVKPTITFDPSTVSFTFKYDLTNSPQSQQRLDNFDLLVGDRSGIVKGLPSSNQATWIPFPGHWDDLKSDDILWIANAMDPYKSKEQLYNPSSETILPGESVLGIGAVATNLPGIRLALYQGWVRFFRDSEETDYVNSQMGTSYITSEDIPRDIEIKLVPQRRYVQDNAVKIQTVGPDVLPTNITNDQLFDRLINLKEQAFKLGWIDNQGVANSLDAKLNEAKIKLQAGQTKVAGNILKSFILDLIAQHIGQTGQGQGQGNPQGKHVNDNAFYLLKPNAEFILYKLGQL